MLLAAGYAYSVGHEDTRLSTSICADFRGLSKLVPGDSKKGSDMTIAIIGITVYSQNRLDLKLVQSARAHLCSSTTMNRFLRPNVFFLTTDTTNCPPGSPKICK